LFKDKHHEDAIKHYLNFGFHLKKKITWNPKICTIDENKLKEPKFIISVSGGAILTVKPKIRDIFCKGVVKAAYSTNGWITTGGSYTGIMKYVGEAAKNDIRSLNEDER